MEGINLKTCQATPSMAYGLYPGHSVGPPCIQTPYKHRLPTMNTKNGNVTFPTLPAR